MLAVGVLNAEVNFKVKNNITIAPIITRFNDMFLESISEPNDKMTLEAYGIRAYFHLNNAFENSFYMSPFYKRWNMSITTNNDRGYEATGTVTGDQFGVIFGFLVQGDYFNTNIGVGYSVFGLGNLTIEDNFGNKSTENGLTPPNAGLALDFSIGFSF